MRNDIDTKKYLWGCDWSKVMDVTSQIARMGFSFVHQVRTFFKRKEVASAVDRGKKAWRGAAGLLGRC